MLLTNVTPKKVNKLFLKSVSEDGDFTYVFVFTHHNLRQGL